MYWSLQHLLKFSLLFCPFVCWTIIFLILGWRRDLAGNAGVKWDMINDIKTN